MCVYLRKCLVHSQRFLLNCEEIINTSQRICSRNSSDIAVLDAMNQSRLSKFDVVIIGAGAIGSSTAFWLKQKAGSAISILVIDRDLTHKEGCSTPLSVGGVRQQFSLKENVQLSLFGADFIQNINQYLSASREDPIDIQFRPNGYLLLATEDGRDILENNHKNQLCWGGLSKLLTVSEMREKLPWLNTEGIKLGCLGQKNEGWFDPWIFLNALKSQAKNLGACFLEATPQEFEFRDANISDVRDTVTKDRKLLKQVVIRRADDKIETIQFKTCIVATGADTGKVTKELLGLDQRNKGLLQFEIPVERRKRYVYYFESPEALEVGSPMIVDPSGLYVRREGLSNKHLCGSSPSEEEEPSTENLDVDYDYFTERLWPILAHRIPIFETLKLKGGWAGFYDYNKFDQNGIVGFHPAYHNLIIAAGFSGHGLQHSPGVGRAVSELLIDGNFRTIDLTNLSFDRVMKNAPITELRII